MGEERRLSELEIGEKAVVKKLLSDGGIRRRFLDIGLIEGTVVECVGKSPRKDPGAYLIRGAVIAIRTKDSREILIGREEGEYGTDRTICGEICRLPKTGEEKEYGGGGGDCACGKSQCGKEHAL